MTAIPAPLSRSRFCTCCASGPLVSRQYAGTHPGVPANRIYARSGRCVACHGLPEQRWCTKCGSGPLRSKHSHPGTPTRLRHGGKGLCGTCYAADYYAGHRDEARASNRAHAQRASVRASRIVLGDGPCAGQTVIVHYRGRRDWPGEVLVCPPCGDGQLIPGPFHLYRWDGQGYRWAPAAAREVAL